MVTMKAVIVYVCLWILLTICIGYYLGKAIEAYSQRRWFKSGAFLIIPIYFIIVIAKYFI